MYIGYGLGYGGPWQGYCDVAPSGLRQGMLN